jgi:hypothetical protein
LARGQPEDLTMDGEREDYSERELEPDDREYEAMTRDAARWRALLDCDRIRILGTGMLDTRTPHFGAEFWVTHPLGHNRSAENERGREVLTTFADAAIAAGKG